MLTRDELGMLNAILYTPPLPPFISDRQQRTRVAGELRDYLKLRADREGVAFELDLAYLADAMAKGCSFFFGVSYCHVGIFGDCEQPEEGFAAAFLMTRGCDLDTRQRQAIGAPPDPSFCVEGTSLALTSLARSCGEEQRQCSHHRSPAAALQEALR